MTTDFSDLELDEELVDAVFVYLDDLRESGVTNMFGARSYIRDEFPSDVTNNEAGALLMEWMHTFGERHPRD